ncbi:MAG: hypothetical protein K0S65_1475 [Labilithrix sp.]|nr:hypothetical protein [Labilithrix sp.]
MAGTNLRALTKRLLTNADLEPAAWLSEEDDGDSDYGRPVALSKLGLSASQELVEYMKLAEDATFRQEVGAILAKEGGFYWGIRPVRSPSSLLFKETSSDVVAFLAGSIPLASDPDSGAYLVATWGSGAPESAVASFLFNDVAPSDPEPRDFVVEGVSIEDTLSSYGAPGRRPKKKAALCQELERLYRRGIWIAQLVQEDDLDSIEDIARTVRDASARSVYAKERAQVDTHVHFAAYWLLSHALLGRTEDLADALERTRDIIHPAIAELRRAFAPVVKNPSAIEKLFAKHRPDWTKKDIATIRSWGDTDRA